MATTPAKVPLILDETYVRQDDQGRYSLNDLHQASGGVKRHQPGNWLANQQTKALIAELESVPGISGTASAVNVVQGGSVQGTFVARELVYAYAMWISPAFHLKVIRTFDALVTGKLVGAGPQQMVGKATGLPLAQLTGLQDQSWKLITRLKSETDPALRAFVYQQFVGVCADLGCQPPPLEAIGCDAPAQPPAVQAFWQAVEQLEAAGVPLNHARRAGQIAVNLHQCAKAAAKHGLRLDAGELRRTLRESRAPRFVDVRPVNSPLLGKAVRCWVFLGELNQGGAA